MVNTQVLGQCFAVSMNRVGGIVAAAQPSLGNVLVATKVGASASAGDAVLEGNLTALQVNTGVVAKKLSVLSV